MKTVGIDKIIFGLNTVYCVMISRKTPVHLSEYQKFIELLPERLPELSKFERDDSDETIKLAEPQHANNPARHFLSVGPDGILYVMGPLVSCRTWQERLCEVSKLLDETLAWRGDSLSAISILRKYLFPVQKNPCHVLSNLLKSKLCNFFDFKGFFPIDFEFRTAYTPTPKETSKRIGLRISTETSLDDFEGDRLAKGSCVVLRLQFSDVYPVSKQGISDLAIVAERSCRSFAEEKLADAIVSLWNACTSPV